MYRERIDGIITDSSINEFVEWYIVRMMNGKMIINILNMYFLSTYCGIF